MEKSEWYIGEHGGSVMMNFKGKELQVTCISPTHFCGDLTEDERAFAKEWESETKGHAEKIVKAVNMHDELFTACEHALDLLREHEQYDNAEEESKELEVLNLCATAIGKTEKVEAVNKEEARLGFNLTTEEIQEYAQDKIGRDLTKEEVDELVCDVYEAIDLRIDCTVESFERKRQLDEGKLVICNKCGKGFDEEEDVGSLKDGYNCPKCG
jgi:hypothetical protein